MSLEREFLKAKTCNEKDSSLDIKFGVKLKKVPPSAKLKDVKAIFKGIKVKNILFQRGGMAIVVLQSSNAIEMALKKDGAPIGKHKIIVRRLKPLTKKDSTDNPSKRQYFPPLPKKKIAEDIEDGGRLYVRNLSYECSENDLDDLFAPFGLLTEVHVPFDPRQRRNKGFAFVTFMHPKDAVTAFEKLDKTEFQNRKLHILPSREPVMPEVEDEEDENEAGKPWESNSSFKREKLAQLRKEAGKASHTWNPLFVNPAALAEVQAQEMGVAKEQLLDRDTKGSAAVRLAQVELALIGEVEEFLSGQGIHVEELKKAPANRGIARSRSLFLIKNLPAFTTADELRPLLSSHGDLQRLEVSHKGVIAVAEFRQSIQAKRAFSSLAFAKFKDSILKVEWAPMLAPPRFQEDDTKNEEKSQEKGEEEVKTKKRKREEHDPEEKPQKKSKTTEKEKKKKNKERSEAKSEKQVDDTPVITTKTKVVLVKNVPFQTNHKELRELFQPFGSLARVRLPKKQGGGIRGFAFAEFEDDEAAQMLLAADKKLHLYGRRLRMEPARAETDLSQMRASAFESIVSAEDALHREKRKKKNI